MNGDGESVRELVNGSTASNLKCCKQHASPAETFNGCKLWLARRTVSLVCMYLMPSQQENREMRGERRKRPSFSQHGFVVNSQMRFWRCKFDAPAFSWLRKVILDRHGAWLWLSVKSLECLFSTLWASNSGTEIDENVISVFVRSKWGEDLMGKYIRYFSHQVIFKSVKLFPQKLADSMPIWQKNSHLYHICQFQQVHSFELKITNF
jgi:hypothetical protein